MKLDINNYPGAKRNSGLDKWIINMIPECSQFVEGFAGSGHISMLLVEAKAGAKIIVCEKSRQVAKQLFSKFNGTPAVVARLDTMVYLTNSLFKKKDLEGMVFYFDPPYIREERLSTRDYYEWEWGYEEHNHFLLICFHLEAMGAKVIISHPACEMYNVLLRSGWQLDKFKTVNRAGRTTEYVYRNFNPSDGKLLVSDYVGHNRTKRQSLKRKAESLLRKITNGSKHEQQYLMDYINRRL